MALTAVSPSITHGGETAPPSPMAHGGETADGEMILSGKVAVGMCILIGVILPLPRMQSWAQALWSGDPSVSSQQHACTWGQLSYDQNSSVVRPAGIIASTSYQGAYSNTPT